jgi:hypothetical protein
VLQTIVTICKDYKDLLGANGIKIFESLFAIFCSESNICCSDFILYFSRIFLSTSKDCAIFIFSPFLTICRSLPQLPFPVPFTIACRLWNPCLSIPTPCLLSESILRESFNFLVKKMAM